MTSPAGSGVPDERRAKWSAIFYSPVIDPEEWHYDNQGYDFVTKLMERIDAEVAAAVSGCRRDQRDRLGDIPLKQPGRLTGFPSQQWCDGYNAGLDTARAALAGEVNPE